MRPRLLFLTVAAAALLPAQQDAPITFRSDVSLVRVDVRVTDRSSRAITNLTARDFLLRDNGQPQEIRNFASEEMPLDVLFLIDVSASMRPHVERLAAATEDAFQSLKSDDHVGIMVFDRTTRLRNPLSANIEAAEAGFRTLLRQEGFNGGTDITRGMLDAGRYMTRTARREARRAIIILTDDRTEKERDENRVLASLDNAETVLSALITPDAMPHLTRPDRRGGSFPGSGWPGDIIFGRRYPGGSVPGGGGYYRTQSAGTPEIARASGGDSLNVADSYALRATLDGIRQRYSLYFRLPPGTREGEQRRISVELASMMARRYPGADLRYRGDYRATATADASAESPTVVSHTPGEPAVEPQNDTVTTSSTPKRRSSGERYGGYGPNPALGGDAATTAASSQTTQSTAPSAATPSNSSTTGGWRRATAADMQAQDAAKPPKKDD